MSRWGFCLYFEHMARIAKKSGAYHHGDLRRVLLDTALRVIEHDGVAALSLQALTRKAGVSSGAPYHHFQNRDELLIAIADQGFELLLAEMVRSSADASDDPLAQLRALGIGYVRFSLAHRGHFRVMFRPELQGLLTEPEQRYGAKTFALLRSAVARCQEARLAPSGDPLPLVLLAWTAVHGACALWIDGSLSTKGLIADEAALAGVIANAIVDVLAAAGRP